MWMIKKWWLKRKYPDKPMERELQEILTKMQRRLDLLEHDREQYEKLWTEEKGAVNTLRREITLLNRALNRKHHRIKGLRIQRDQRNLALADANDQMAQVFHNASDAQFVRNTVAQLRDDINMFCAAHHGGAWDKQMTLFPGLTKLLRGPSVLEKETI